MEAGVDSIDISNLPMTIYFPPLEDYTKITINITTKNPVTAVYNINKKR